MEDPLADLCAVRGRHQASPTGKTGNDNRVAILSGPAKRSSHQLKGEFAQALMPGQLISGVSVPPFNMVNRASQGVRLSFSTASAAKSFRSR